MNFIFNSCKVSWEVISRAGKFSLLHCVHSKFKYEWANISWGVSCVLVLSLILKSLSWFQTRSPSKAASMFSGTQEKCATCGKTAYPLEKVKFYYSLNSFCCDILHGKSSIFIRLLTLSALLFPPLFPLFLVQP